MRNRRWRENLMYKNLLRTSRVAGVTTTIAALGLLAMACGDTGDSSADMTLPPDLILADLKAPEYPNGPFGGDPGSVLPNFTFQGYFSPTQTTGYAKSLPNMFGEVNFDMI